MAAITQDNVKVTESEWSLISDATVQTLQLLNGLAGVIYASSQPASTIAVGSKGHELAPGKDGFLNNTSGGSSWGRASEGSGAAIFAVTEG